MSMTCVYVYQVVSSDSVHVGQMWATNNPALLQRARVQEICNSRFQSAFMERFVSHKLGESNPQRAARKEAMTKPVVIPPITC